MLACVASQNDVRQDEEQSTAVAGLTAVQHTLILAAGHQLADISAEYHA